MSDILAVRANEKRKQLLAKAKKSEELYNEALRKGNLNLAIKHRKANKSYLKKARYSAYRLTKHSS